MGRPDTYSTRSATGLAAGAIEVEGLQQASARVWKCRGIHAYESTGSTGASGQPQRPCLGSRRDFYPLCRALPHDDASDERASKGIAKGRKSSTHLDYYRP